MDQFEVLWAWITKIFSRNKLFPDCNHLRRSVVAFAKKKNKKKKNAQHTKISNSLWTIILAFLFNFLD